MSTLERSAWITGWGTVGPQGMGRASVEALLRQPRTCFAPTPPQWLSTPGTPDTYIAALPAELASEVHRVETVSTDRSCALALLAAEQAWAQANPAFDSERAGVFWGTGMGGLLTTETSYERLFSDKLPLRPMTVVRIMANSAASQLAMQYGLRGPNLTYSVACASSAIALGEALYAIRSGRVDIALVGGSEAMLAPGVLSAWGALRVVSPRSKAPSAALACRPFCADRTGLVLGEGASCFVLESEAHAKARGAKALALLSGYGSSCDANSLVHPQVDGQVRAMHMALRDANLQPADIGSINAHATGTGAGDQTEANALLQVFGDSMPPVSATKSMHGHLLGATGAFEAALCVASLQHGLLPATLGAAPLDPACTFVDLVGEQPRQAPNLQAALSNSFAFGGSNASLVFQRAP